MVAVVTGGSRGIGKAVAEELLKKDFTVIVTARGENSETKAMEKQYNGLFDDDKLDLSVDMEALTLACKRDGLLEDENGEEK